jgi:hypothetical protein
MSNQKEFLVWAKFIKKKPNILSPHLSRNTTNDKDFTAFWTIILDVELHKLLLNDFCKTEIEN